MNNNCKRCGVTLEDAHFFCVEDETMWICHPCWIQWDIYEKMYDHAKKLFIGSGKNEIEIKEMR